MTEEKWTWERYAWTIEIYHSDKRIVKFNAAELLYQLDSPEAADKFNMFMNVLADYANTICEERNKE